jgi:hypothetical protein
MRRILFLLLVPGLLACAYDAPFTTDADLAGYVGDLAANVIGSGAPPVFQHEGIEAVEIDGGLARVLDRGYDWVRVACSAGPHRVRLRCGSARQAPAPATGDPAAVLAQFGQRLASAKPGDEVVVPNGTYLDWRTTIACSGTAEKPIVIRPETPGGVTFMRNTRFTITGSHVVFRNFRFVQTADLAVRIAGGDRNRLTQLQFLHCGGGKSTFANIVRIENESDENRIDHCYWTGSKCMSVSLRSAFENPELIGKHNRIEYNVFRDIERIWINGQEAIQLGQGFPWVARPETFVQHNLFDNVWGDSETFSSKTSGNVFRYNVAANCLKSGFCLRGGDDALVEGNVLVNNAVGIRAYGRNHRIVNNLFIGNRGPAVQLQIGHLDGRSHGYPSTNQLIAHNTMVNNGGGIGVYKLTDREDWQPVGNRVVNNIFAGQAGTYISPSGQRAPVVRRNLFQPGPGIQIGLAGEEPITADAKLVGAGETLRPAPDSPAVDAACNLPEVRVDRYGRPRPVGKAPDLGAEEIGADPNERPFLPPIPEVRTWDLAFYQAEPLPELVGETPSEQAVRSAGPLPEDFVLTFEFRPESFRTEAGVAFQGRGPGDGYQLRWGGADEKGIPRGLVVLDKCGTRVGEGPDTVYYRRNYVPSFPNRTVAIHRTSPFPDLWYEGRLLVHHGRIRFSLNIAQRAEKSPRNIGRFATVVWEDRGQIAGPVPVPGAVSLACTASKGAWRNVRLWKARDLRTVPPVAPTDLTATPIGLRAVRLQWGNGPDGLGASRRYELYRQGGPAMPTDSADLVASGFGLQSFCDFQAPQEGICVYWLRVGNLSGQWVESKPVRLQLPGTGAFFGYTGVKDFTKIEFPMSRGRDAEAGLDYISGAGAPRRMDGPGTDGYADVAFSVPKDGKYVLWGLVDAPDSGSDSFYLSLPELNGGKPVPYYTGTGTWFWSRLPIPDGTVLKQGGHRLRLHIRESRTRLAAILVTDQLDWKPMGR